MSKLLDTRICDYDTHSCNESTYKQYITWFSKIYLGKRCDDEFLNKRLPELSDGEVLSIVSEIDRLIED